MTSYSNLARCIIVKYILLLSYDFFFPCNLVKCDRAIDLFFVLDGSASVELCNFKKVQHFLAKELAEMDISPNVIHVGLLQFGRLGESRIEFGLNEKNSRESAVPAMEKFKYLNGFGTALGTALKQTGQVRTKAPFLHLSYAKICCTK